MALMNSKIDFEIARTLNWYRIPIESAPKIVKQNSLKYISFYHTKAFEKLSHSIRWFAQVKNVSIVKRKELFPELFADPKADKEYYKIEFSPLLSLPKDIVSLRHRRLLFISTSEVKFFQAAEINELFNDSPLEELLWARLVSKKITAERQYFITIDNYHFFLDFAVLCKVRNIDIECDGDKFHTTIKNVQSDKRRNNLLEREGWSVLRFTSDDLQVNFTNSMNIIYDTINKYGGIQDINSFDNYKYILGDDEQQLKLFD